MRIVHRIDDFLYTLFPSVEQGDHESLLDKVSEYYTFGPYKPKVEIENDWIRIDIDFPTIISQEADYKKVVSLCENGKYPEAKRILTSLISKNPTVSEYHRIMGQILSDEGNQDEAINCLIDALRWDSKNGWALMMMGNIFSRYKGDMDTALKYYDRALYVNPKDYISMTNIGANLLQKGMWEEAKKYLNEALLINDKYPNTHFALGMIAENEGDLQTAFDRTLISIKNSKNQDNLYKVAVTKLIEIASEIIETGTGRDVYRKYRVKLEVESGRSIDIVTDETIPTAAKFEFAEIYKRENHVVRYKPDKEAVEHLIMHELVHLEFVTKARKENTNKLFISNQEHKAKFIGKLGATIQKLGKMGVPEAMTTEFCLNLFDGLNRLVFNGPVDLFIESYLYNQFPELRAFQFTSLLSMIQENIAAVNDKRVLELSPKEIVSKNKVYNIVGALQFKDLFGMELSRHFNATPGEMKQAKAFYNEYLQYTDNKEPGEEYELVQNWANDLDLDGNFELVDENEFWTKRTDIDNLITSIEEDPFDLNSEDPAREREMQNFIETQANIGTNMAVVMFMIEALRFFEKMPTEKIRDIAVEIALQGAHGYRPGQDGYRVGLIPGKTFSGYHILAYYYVSWALASPEMVGQLHLPFSSEYELAKQMYKSDKW